MRVLMVGWEFPPHISGGLGTACRGLTGGLARSGVDVTFVVPRRWGDEDARHLRLLAVGDAPREGRSPEAASAPPGSGAASPGAIRVIGVEAPPLPYRRPSGSARSRSAAAAGTGREEAIADAVDAGEGDRPAGSSGGYGRGLFAEVERYARGVEALARAESFDLVHVHDWMTVPAGIRARRISGRPLVLHVHSTEFDRAGAGGDGRIRAVEQDGLDAADRVVCVSRFTAGVLLREYRVDPSRIRVLHNAVDPAAPPPPEPPGRIPGGPVVLFLGRVTFQKGPDYFLEAAARILRAEPGVRFVMSGDGDMLPRMIEETARLGIARSVSFTGFLRGPEVARMLSMADVLVMPSVSEPFGIVPLEAMALEVPVVVSRQSGVSEILRNALKADFWDVRDIADKVLAVLRNPPLSRLLAEQGRGEVAAMRWEERGRLLRRIYEEVLP